MKNLGISILVGAAIAFMFSTCKKETIYEDKEVIEVYETIKKIKPEIEISKSQIVNAMAPMSTEPCVWDFNYDGMVSTTDLATFLSLYGVKYNATDLTAFLAAFGQIYDLDIIPAWNNYVQDVTPEMQSFSKIKCNGEFLHTFGTSQPSIDFDETNWYYEDSLVWQGSVLINTVISNGDTLVAGWDNPCNGAKEITLEIIHNDKVYRRSGVSWIAYFGQPETCSSITGLGVFDAFNANTGYTLEVFPELYFCTNCN